MIETWRDIEGYEGKYQVSNYGNVKSLNYRRTGKEHPFSPTTDEDNYLQVVLCKNGKQKSFKVHKLVANAFIPNKEDFKYVNEEDRLKYINNLDKLQVNHKDERHENNNANNLEWCTLWYNEIYGTRNERVGEAMTNNPKISKKLHQLTLDDIFVKEWPSTQEVQRQTGYNQSAIWRCCAGKKKTAYGYKWCYVD